MLQISDIATSWMRSAFPEEDEDDNQCFRIIVTGRGVQLMRGEERPGDVVAYSDGGKVVLVLDAVTAECLEDLGVDYYADTSELVFALLGDRVLRQRYLPLEGQLRFRDERIGDRF